MWRVIIGRGRHPSEKGFWHADRVRFFSLAATLPSSSSLHSSPYLHMAVALSRTPFQLGEAAIFATLNHLCLAHHDGVRCFSASSWLHMQMDSRLKERIVSVLARARRATTYQFCRGCLKGGRFKNHYGFCAVCRSIHKPEVRRRVLIHGPLGIPQSLMWMLPRRPGTRQHPVALEDVWKLFEVINERSGKRGRAWCRRMQRYNNKEAFIEAFRDLVIRPN